MADSLPNVGDLNWGPVLNNYITNDVLSVADEAETTITSHQVAPDPHGDRAYAQSLLTALNNAANSAGGFVLLNSFGKIPTALVAAGGITDIFDVVAEYGATGNGTTDDSTAINTALAAAATAGGGEVWIPNGVYAIGTNLVIGANTWLHLSPGATIKRIANPSVPAYMLTNFTTTATPAAGNILVTGGTWSVGATTQACTMMAFINSKFISVGQTQFTNSAASGSTGILLAGCSSVLVGENLFLGAAPSSRATNTAVVRIEAANSTTIAGLAAGAYTSLGCQGVLVRNNIVSPTTATDGSGPFGLYGYLAATTLNSSISHSNILIQGNYANGLAQGAFLATGSWSFLTVSANQLINSGASIPSTNINSIGSDANNIQVSGLNAFYPNGTQTSRATNTTLTADPILQLTALAPNGIYEINIVINYNGAASSGNFKWNFAVPGGANFYYGATYLPTSGNPVVESHIGSDVSVAETTGVANNLVIMMRGYITMGSGAGTFSFNWAQSTSNATNCHVLSGSFMSSKRIG